MPFIDKAIISSWRGEQYTPESESIRDRAHEEAFKRILGWVGVRERSCAEVRGRLERLDFKDEVIAATIERAKRCLVLDDSRFASSLVRTRLASGKGRQAIEAELRDHHVDPLILEGWPEEFFPSEETELQRAIDLLESKPPMSKNKREAAYRRLIGKGYSSSIASSAARIWFEVVSAHPTCEGRGSDNPYYV
jgi:regulatory protein